MSAIEGRLWTDEERDELRRLVATGSTIRDAAQALGRSVPATAKQAGVMKLKTWDGILSATRESIRHFDAEGWSESRIAKRFGVSPQAVAHILGKVSA